MDEVQATHETVVITKHGKPVAKLVPLSAESDEIYGFLAGRGRIAGDVLSLPSPEKNGANSGDHGGHARCGLAHV